MLTIFRWPDSQNWVNKNMSQRFFEGALHAVAYAKFRPTPPKQLGPLIINYLREKVIWNCCKNDNIYIIYINVVCFLQYQGPLNLTVDVGCGNGQSSTLLSTDFQKVLATDISQAQVDVAKTLNHPSNIQFLYKKDWLSHGSLSNITFYFLKN